MSVFIFSSEINEEFCQFLYTVLTRKFVGCDKRCNLNCICNLSEKSAVEIGKSNSDSSCKFSESKLPRGCVLERIYSMQKLNDKGLDYYREIYKSQQIDEQSYVRYVDQLLDELNRNGECPGCLVENGFDLQHIDDLNNSQNANEINLLKYLLFAIARDCSLMITFRKVIGENR